jgi:hypothetical protein
METMKISAPIVHKVESQNSLLGAFGFKKIGAGSTERYPGVSHLCEHLVCCSWDDMDDWFTRRGLTKNAATGDSSIHFYFAGLDDYVLATIENVLLRGGSRNLFNWEPSEAEFERERRVVIQEYEGYLSHAFNALYVNLGRRFYNCSGAIGNREIIEEISYANFIEFYREQSLFDSFVYVGYQQNQFGEFESKLIEGRPAPRLAAVSARPYKTLAEYKNSKIEYYGSSDKQTIIGDWIEMDDSVAPWEIAFISELFDAGMNSPLMSKLRTEQGLAYAAQCFRAFEYAPVLMSYITVNPDNVDKARTSLRDIYVNWEATVTEARFTDVVDRLKIRWLMRHAMNYAPENMFISTATPDSVVSAEHLELITYARICEILEKFFKHDNIRRAQVGSTVEI